MRKTVLTFAPVLLSVSLSAQGVFSNKTQVTLEKVIQDYPNHFTHIKGELIGQATQTARYRSTVQVPGSTSSTVILTNSSTEGYGWSCTVLETASFETAKSRYAELYGQLSNSIIASSSQKTFILSGQYVAPTEDHKSSHVSFSLLPAVGELKNLKVELSLQEEGGQWRIILSAKDKDMKEVTQGEMTSN
ncbi:MAG: hypothetical protein JST68_03015 [Bacteroidetes bacterium]|nr:hypothetical protein [Bacteroidota bacterium]